MNKEFREKNNYKDESNMEGAIRSFPSQIKESFELIKNIKLELHSEVDKIIFLGMGGSAIGADCIKTILFSCLDIPVFICRSYEIPNWVNEKTLVVACSYSGNTEETLSGFSACIDRTQNIFVVSTGGRLVELAKRKNISCLILPSGFQPRAAIGYSITFNLLLLNKLSLISNGLVEEIFKGIKDLENFSLGLSLTPNPAYLLASKLSGYMPIIYGSSNFGDIIGLRFANQLSENSKILSFSSSIPEQNHNEIEGWNSMNNYSDKLCVVFIKDKDENSQVMKRQQILSQLISKLNVKVFDIEVNHSCRAIRFLKLIHMVDWTSFYLAIKNNINPTPVETIEKFKLTLLNE